MKECSTEQSQVDPSRFNLRNKGVRLGGGRLHKGCVKDAFTKLSIGSIPSNYESIIYRYEEKRGFGASQKRFGDDTCTSEIIKAELQEQEEVKKMYNTSYSTKGYGPFIAKEKREWYKVSSSPGPGKYFDEKLTEEKPKRKEKHCYTRQREDSKRKELMLNKQNINNPGPGYYEIDSKPEHILGGWKSSFVTKDSREGYIPKSSTPGPGCYNDPSNAKVLKRRQMQEEELFTKLALEKKSRGKHFLPKQKQAEAPGPGYYDLQMPDFKPLYERIKISNAFIQGGRDRFNDPMDQVVQAKGPSPASYEMRSQFEVEKKLIEMSCFMSESNRRVFEVGSACGEMCYEMDDGGRNFHFNVGGKWV